MMIGGGVTVTGEEMSVEKTTVRAWQVACSIGESRAQQAGCSSMQRDSMPEARQSGDRRDREMYCAKLVFGNLDWRT